MSSANLEGANLTGANFMDADMTDTDFRAAGLALAVLLRTNVTGARMDTAVDLNFAYGHELQGVPSLPPGATIESGVLVVR